LTAQTARAIEVIGHGGAGHFYPGNSRQSIEQALEIGVDRIEFDVQLSADGDLVLVHDDYLRGPSGRKRAVRAIPTAEIRTLLPGLLTFDEAVDLIGGRALLLIDVKSPRYEAEVAAAIQRHNLGAENAVSSSHAGVLRYLRHRFPELRLGISTGHMANSIPFKPARTFVSGGLQLSVPSLLAVAARAIGATDVMVQYRACSPRLVRLMHRKGIRVNAWTVDHPRQIRRVIDMGVDGVISNRPDLVKEALGRP
jgi:glycerophosphoryl diester phosphodiesterase